MSEELQDEEVTTPGTEGEAEVTATPETTPADETPATDGEGQAEEATTETAE